MTATSPKHLLGIEPLDVADITTILDRADRFADGEQASSLEGKVVVNFFGEPSTRTRSSFEIAAKRLSASVLNFNISSSSTSKGESLFDTVHTIEAMGTDVLVVRHAQAGAPQRVAGVCKSAVVNAGDGAHEHPTQGLLDALTIRRKFGRLEGLKVVILGDVLHSRVARSNVHLLTRFGASVTLCGPPTLMPAQAERLGVDVVFDIESALPGADVVMALRMQRERMSRGYVPSMADYARLYSLTEERLAMAAEHAIAMHPGPMNRGVEIDSRVADGPRSVILDQVKNGVFTRMAVLEWVLGETP